MDKFFPRVILSGTTDAGYPPSTFCECIPRGEGGGGEGRRGGGGGNFFPARRAFAEGLARIGLGITRPPIKFLHWSASVIRNRYVPTTYDGTSSDIV